MTYSRSRYHRKSHRHPAHRRGYESRFHHRQSHHPRFGRGQRYYHYHYPQPSSQQVYVEEPETDSESSESEYDGYAQSDSDEEVYDFDLQRNDSKEDSEFESDNEGYEEVFIIADDTDDFIDMNDALELDAVDAMEADGKVRDVNDDLVRYYDSDSESESDSDSELDIMGAQSDSDIESESDYDVSEMDTDEEVILLLDSDLENLSDIESDSESDNESVTDLEVDSSSDEELQLESVRKTFAEKLEPSDEEDSDISTEAEYDDDVFFEVDSNYTSSDDEDVPVDVDAGDPVYYEYYVSDDSDSDSSDEEGVTIYKHRFDLPDRYDSENDSTDEELNYSDDEELLRANDSDDEFEIVDLTKDLKDSKDCELVELDDNTYKLNLRLPSIIKEDLKVDFLKNQNELLISGKFDFTADESDSDIELAESDDEEVYQSAEESKSGVDSGSESESSDSESDLSNSSSSSSSESESDDSSSPSESESYDSDSESETEEDIREDAQQLIKDFQKQEIQFEKRFQFDKVIKFDEIKATFLPNGELELIIPNEGVEMDRDNNTVSINIEDAAQSPEPRPLGDDDELTPVVEFVAEDDENVQMES